MVEVLTGFETENRYKIFAKTMPANMPLLQAREVSTCCSRSCLGSKRPFEMEIFSPQTKQSVMKLIRPFKCCLSEIQVLDSRDQVIGWVKQKCAACSRSLLIYDQHATVIYEVYGPWYTHKTRYPVVNVVAVRRGSSV